MKSVDMTLAEVAVLHEYYMEAFAHMKQICDDVTAAFCEVEIDGAVMLKLVDRAAAWRAWEAATMMF